MKSSRCRATLYPRKSTFPGAIQLENELPCWLSISPLSEEKLSVKLSAWLGLERVKASTVLYLAPDGSHFAGHICFGLGRYRVIARLLNGPRISVALDPLHLRQGPPQLESVTK